MTLFTSLESAARLYFWLGASAEEAETGSREPGLASRPGPSGFDPARKCDACGRPLCFTDHNVLCGCNIMPWAIDREEEE